MQKFECNLNAKVVNYLIYFINVICFIFLKKIDI